MALGIINKMDNEVQPKFMTNLNSSEKKKVDLDTSDQFEAQEIIDSLNHIEMSKKLGFWDW